MEDCWGCRGCRGSPPRTCSRSVQAHPAGRAARKTAPDRLQERDHRAYHLVLRTSRSNWHVQGLVQPDPGQTRHYHLHPLPRLHRAQPRASSSCPSLPPHVHSKPTLSFCFQRRTSCSSSGADVSPKLHIFDVARCCKHVATGAELRRTPLPRIRVNSAERKAEGGSRIAS